MLFCESLSDHADAESIFNLINNFITSNNISWSNCVGMCTDGCPTMLGNNGGLKARVHEIAPHVKFTHCMIHRQALAAKSMQAALKSVMDNAVSVINFIRSRALQSRLFERLCDDMGSVHHNLLLHTAVRWLSRGKCLTGLFKMRHEVFLFLSEQKHELADCFSDQVWLGRLACEKSSF
jgi:hypothetical protein